MPKLTEKKVMLINVNCAKCIGIQAVPVTVEIDISSGIGIHLVGLADVAVKESLLRTMTALQSMGFRIPGKKIVINLAPADVRKNGSGYDVPIAIGIIAASGQRELPGLEKYLIMGELGLDASIRAVPGALPIAEFASEAGFRGCILPEESAYEAAELPDTEIYGVRNLDEVLRILGEEEDVADLLIGARTTLYQEKETPHDYMDLSEIAGQEGARRGIEIAAAGGHNLIMVGPPGSGKTSLAKAMIGIMPPLQLEEAIETSKIYSIAGLHTATFGLIKERPFRAPHHSASLAAVIGGGNGENIIPGEVSLAQNGILFLDEFAQLPKSITESLRGPLEDRRVIISRLRSKVEFPASFMLVAASNPCPCGYYGIPGKCSCTPAQRQSYIARLSGPIMDRIDIQLTLRPIPPEQIVRYRKNESSAAVAQRVRAAREVQKARFKGTGIHVNAEMTGEMIREFCPLSEECAGLMEKISSGMGLSARAFSRILKVARTIADLEAAGMPGSGADAEIKPKHLLEASGYRFLDRI